MQESYKPQLKKNYIHVTLNLCWMTHLACFTHMSTQSLQTSHVSQAVHVSKHTFFLRPNKYLIPYHHGGIHINLIYNKEKKRCQVHNQHHSGIQIKQSICDWSANLQCQFKEVCSSRAVMKLQFQSLYWYLGKGSMPFLILQRKNNKKVKINK